MIKPAEMHLPTLGRRLKRIISNFCRMNRLPQKNFAKNIQPYLVMKTCQTAMRGKVSLPCGTKQVHPAVCSASCGMHFIYLYMNQVSYIYFFHLSIYKCILPYAPVNEYRICNINNFSNLSLCFSST